MQDDPIVREIRIAAPPDAVFSFLVDPERLVRWIGARANVVARPGGEFRVEFPRPDGGLDVVRGEFVEVQRPRLVVFTWGFEGNEILPPGASRVEVALRPDGDATLVRLVHRGLPDVERPSHADGWEHFLGRLSVAAEGRAA